MDDEIYEKIKLLVESLYQNRTVCIEDLDPDSPILSQWQLLREILNVNANNEYSDVIVDLLRSFPDQSWTEGTISESLFKCLNLSNEDKCLIDCSESIIPKNDYYICEYPVYMLKEENGNTFLERFDNNTSVITENEIILYLDPTKHLPLKEKILSILKEKQIRRIVIMSTLNQAPPSVVYIDSDGNVSNGNDEISTTPVSPIDNMKTNKVSWLDNAKVSKKGPEKAASPKKNFGRNVIYIVIFVAIVALIVWIIWSVLKRLICGRKEVTAKYNVFVSAPPRQVPGTAQVASAIPTASGLGGTVSNVGSSGFTLSP